MSRVSASLIRVLLLALLSAPGMTVAQDKSADYRLHAGDSITVSVWKELDLQRKVMIRPDGRFSFPLAGEVQAAGARRTRCASTSRTTSRSSSPRPW